MSNVTAGASVRDAALRLAQVNALNAPTIQQIYLFRSDREIRLVEIDPDTLPVDAVRPFYFRADPTGGYPYPIAMALITPEDEEKHIRLPKGWGGWGSSELIWERGENTDG